MNALAMVAGICALCLAAMLLLSQAMDRHAGGEPGPLRRAALRLGAAGLAGLALWYCLEWWGGAVGTVVWFGCLSLAALGLAWLLAYAPQW